MKKIPIFLIFALGAIACKEDTMTPPCTENLLPECACYLIYAPVCGCNDKTYSNDCIAECNGITDYTPGACP